jgi:hypothetical protein
MAVLPFRFSFSGLALFLHIAVFVPTQNLTAPNPPDPLGIPIASCTKRAKSDGTVFAKCNDRSSLRLPSDNGCATEGATQSKGKV